LELDDFKLRKSLKKRLKHFEIKIDSSFREVVSACAQIQRKDQDGTWIVSEVLEAYVTLHEMGYAHSVEAYQDGRLVGGLYGVTVGGVFCGESMFSYVSDASKSAFAFLVERLKEWGYEFIDAQVPTLHVKSLGAKEVSREFFLDRLSSCANKEVDRESWIV
jgi:leucyl/phenylalanyl-tRNA--protein transferase